MAVPMIQHSKHGSLSATQNIHYKMAVSLILRTFITKWQSLWYSDHSSQNGSHSDNQNNHHKMAVTLILRTFITKWQSLCYPKHSQNCGVSATQNIPTSCFLMDTLVVSRCNWNLNVSTHLKIPDTKFHYKQFVCSLSVILAQKQTHYP